MAKYAALVSSASEGAVTTGRRMTSALERARRPEGATTRRRRADHGRMTVRIGFKTSPQDVDWATVDATWARAGELAADPAAGFDSGWLNDHLTNMDADVPGRRSRR